MKNPFKKKAPAPPSTPREYVMGTRDLGVDYETALENAKALVSSYPDYSAFNLYARATGRELPSPSPDRERIIYRLVPVAVVKSQPPTMEPATPSTT